MPEAALALPAADGSVLRGVWTLPGRPGPWPAVLCLHGLTLTHAAFAPLAALLADVGIASLRLHLRGHGDSGGALADLGFDDLRDDVARGLAALSARPDVDGARLGVLGFSMGGALAAVAWGGERPLALWSPLLRTQPWDEARLSQYGPPQGERRPLWDGILVHRRLFEEARREDPWAAAVQRPGPVLLAHGAKDRNHPQAASVELAGARAGLGRGVASYFPAASGHQWRDAAERTLRDRLTAEFLRGTL